MSPAYERQPTFVRDWAALTTGHRRQFLAAVMRMVTDVKAGRGFRPSVRVKGVQGRPGVFEMPWAPDGRPTWQHGPEQRPGEPQHHLAANRQPRRVRPPLTERPMAERPIADTHLAAA